MKKLFLLLCLPFLIAADDCNETTASEEESLSVDQQQERYVRNQPIPTFEFSLERHLMTELYKARNNAVHTFSLTWDEHRGDISWSCPSIGYPIPGGTQLTNPQYIADHYPQSGYAILPQPEPNGIFSPETDSGTYVMCLNDDGTVSPVYVESDVRTFAQVMEVVNGRLVPTPGTGPSYRINLHPDQDQTNDGLVH